MTVWSKILILNNINGLQRNYEEWKLYMNSNFRHLFLRCSVTTRNGNYSWMGLLFAYFVLQRNYEEWKLFLRGLYG